ncbi:MAG TPA: hypothetical protein VGD91_08640, partial [Trebonia sp.]
MPVGVGSGTGPLPDGLAEGVPEEEAETGQVDGDADETVGRAEPVGLGAADPEPPAAVTWVPLPEPEDAGWAHAELELPSAATPEAPPVPDVPDCPGGADAGPGATEPPGWALFPAPLPSVPVVPLCGGVPSTVELAWMIACRTGCMPSESATTMATAPSAATPRSHLAPRGGKAAQRGSRGELTAAKP